MLLESVEVVLAHEVCLPETDPSYDDIGGYSSRERLPSRSRHIELEKLWRLMLGRIAALDADEGLDANSYCTAGV